MNRNILITGISGFVGQNLSNYLSQNPDLIKFGVSRYGDEKEGLITYQELFSKKDSYNSYIHLAGKAHDTDYSTSKETFYEANFVLTKKLFDLYLKDKKARYFIFVSSIAAVGSSSGNAIKEEAEPNPNGYYGESKREAEKYLLNNMPDDDHRKVIILRPPMIHGPGNKGNLNLLYNVAKYGIPWPLGSFENHRSFLSIDNLMYVIEQILLGNIESGVYHVADDESFSTNELVDLISEVNDKTPRICNIPKPFIQVVAKVGNMLPLPLNEKRLEKLTENYLVCNKKIKKALNIEKMPVSAREGMIKTLESFRNS